MDKTTNTWTGLAVGSAWQEQTNIYVPSTEGRLSFAILSRCIDLFASQLITTTGEKQNLNPKHDQKSCNWGWYIFFCHLFERTFLTNSKLFESQKLPLGWEFLSFDAECMQRTFLWQILYLENVFNDTFSLSFLSVLVIKCLHDGSH